MVWVKGSAIPGETLVMVRALPARATEIPVPAEKVVVAKDERPPAEVKARTCPAVPAPKSVEVATYAGAAPEIPKTPVEPKVPVVMLETTPEVRSARPEAEPRVVCPEAYRLVVVAFVLVALVKMVEEAMSESGEPESKSAVEVELTVWPA